MRRALILAFVVALSPTVSAGVLELDRAVVSKTLLRSPPPYRYALVDLNGDTVLDAVVRPQGEAYCTSDSCPMYVFRGSASGYEFLSGSAATREPVLLLREVREGWRTLAVWAQDFNVPLHQVLMPFLGDGYPMNANYYSSAKPEDLVGALELSFQERKVP
jgi:hypothetical protein